VIDEKFFLSTKLSDGGTCGTAEIQNNSVSFQNGSMLWQIVVQSDAECADI
jgi:hypothetical protein